MNLDADAAAALEQISRYHMPFGRFGPKHYPPKGVPSTISLPNTWRGSR
ncbi:MAG TPA: hypothetical protein VK474_10790 [Chthoniobacterales bacterium]|nr:hypothetical protein [Chthoniobacterales bacterium]